MSGLREAAQQALEALEALQGGCTDSNDGTVEAITVWCPEVIDALRAALEQPEQEPVLVVEKEPDYTNRGHFYEGSKPFIDPTKVWKLPIGTKLFAHPHRREWRGLTEDENNKLSHTMVKGYKSVNWLAYAIEAALKERNK